MTDGEIHAELERLRDAVGAVEQRFLDFREKYNREQEALKVHLDEYKETVRAKHAEMNQVREQINQERGRYPTFDVLNSAVQALDTKISSLANTMQARFKPLEETISNYQGRLWMLGAALSTLWIVLKIFWK
jgi:SMC interacting uncharacterized protein involved in chromosome segregation